jgi:DNA-directed RNA polymerase specialized sigma24 family protein
MTVMDGAKCLTKMEAMVVQKCHHGLDGLPRDDAAKGLDITRRMVDAHLASAKVKAPGLFPILTPKQAQILHLYTIEGWSVAMIAEVRSISEATVRGYLRRLRKAGVLNDDRPSRPLSFDENTMSDKVVRQW